MPTRYFVQQGTFIGYLIAFELPYHHQVPFQHSSFVPLMMSILLRSRGHVYSNATQMFTSRAQDVPGNVVPYRGFRAAYPMKGGLMPFLIFC